MYQTKQNAFVTEQELVENEVLDTSKSSSNITGSILAETDTATLDKELQRKSMKEYYEAVKQVFDFLMKEAILTKWLDQSRYIISFQTKLYTAINLTTYCSFQGNGSKNYMKFREERFLKKEKAC